MRTPLHLFIAILCAAWLNTLGGCRAEELQDAGSSVALAPTSEARLREIPPFELTDSSGKQVTAADLRGAPWVIATFFTSCGGPCPRLIGDMRSLLDEPLGPDSRVRLVAITVDPERDTPQKLAEYAKAHTADLARWSFLTGDEQSLHGFIMNGLKLAVGKLEVPEDPLKRYADRIDFTHSTRLTVVDAEGRIAGYYQCGGEHADSRLALTRAEIDANFAAVLARVRFLEHGQSQLPLLNAILNGTAFVLLIAGLLAIRAGHKERHARIMRVTFLVSAAFLASYLYYHLVVQAVVGPTPFHGTGVLRWGYLGMLLTHVLLAVINLPMVLRTLWLAHKERWDEHKKWARRTFPIWLYVSFTGVLIYLILYQWNPAPSLG